MAVKTQGELASQNNSTFPNNTSGLIVPTNHRAYNEDVVDTAFAMAGEITTIAEILNHKANQTLVKGKIYIVLSSEITNNLGGYIHIMATDIDEICQYAFVDCNPYTILLSIDTSTISPWYVIQFLNQPLASISWGILSGWVSAVNFGSGVEIIGKPINDDASNFPFVKTRVVFGDAGAISQFNAVAASGLSGNPNHFVGTFNETRPLEFHPNSGDANMWGTANVGILGGLGTCGIYPANNVPDLSLISANFIRVNDVITGQLRISAQCTFGQPINPQLIFDLPFPYGADYKVIGHGVFGGEYQQSHFGRVIVSGFSSNSQQALVNIHLMDNHNGLLEDIIDLTFTMRVY